MFAEFFFEGDRHFLSQETNELDQASGSWDDQKIRGDLRKLKETQERQMEWRRM